MPEYHSYDIFVLGLKDPSKAGRQRFVGAMERLTGRPRDEFERSFPSPQLPVFQAQSLEKTKKLADSFETSGILIEIRPSQEQPLNGQGELEEGRRACPACDAVQPSTNIECERCGVVFAKFERE